jgi:DNA-binding response OmpR family regulator
MAKKVLFINRANPASIIPELLTGAGHEVKAVTETAAGLTELELHPYDMVILMENADAESWKPGAEIRRRMTSPLIIISAGASAETCVKAINAGADFFLRKPFGPMELMARVNALFQRSPDPQLVSIKS